MREVSIFCLGTSYYMFFKGILFAARAGKAHGLLLRQKYNESFRVLKKLLDSEPEKYLLPNIYENLGVVEYYRGNYESSIYYLELCLESLWDYSGGMDYLERISWYLEANDKKLKSGIR